MVLGTLTFEENPSEIDLLIPDRISSEVGTLESVAFFSWGVTLIGKKISLKWSTLPSEQFDDIQALIAADAAVVFDPEDGLENTYNVEIKKCTGKYFKSLDVSATVRRKDVELVLLILSEA
jgi:hypothetical protein